jgi:hypothetical protein
MGPDAIAIRHPLAVLHLRYGLLWRCSVPWTVLYAVLWMVFCCSLLFILITSIPCLSAEHV